MNDFELTKTVVKRIPRRVHLPEIKKIFLKYQKPQYAKDEDCVWVDLDSHSGGYPYATNVMRAHDFKTVEEARRYRGKNDEFDIVEVTFKMEEKVLEKWTDTKRYQVKARNAVNNNPREWTVMDSKLDIILAVFFSEDMASAYAKQLNDLNK